MKKVLIYSAVFLVIFIIAFLIFLPMQQIVDSALYRVLSANRIALRYSNVESGLFSTKINGLIFNNQGEDIDLGNLVIKYSPFSIITQKAVASADTPYGKATAVHTKGTINADIDIDMSRIAKLFSQNATGELKGNAMFNYKEKNGTFELQSGPFTVQTPLMKFTGDSIKGDGSISDNTLVLNRLETTGQSQVKVSGQITFEPTNFYRSAINLTGEGKIMGMGSNFVIRGTIGSPQFLLQ